MDEKLKYRLVGASVILALAVFFLPMILDSEKYRSQIQSQIPAVPSEHKSQHVDIENSSAKQPDKTELDGPLEKGPLVINLDDMDENKPSASSNSNSSNDQPSQQPISQIQEPIKQEQAKTTKPEAQPKQEVVAKTKPENKPKTEAKPSTTDLSSKQVEQGAESNTSTTIEPESVDDSELAFSDTAWLIQIGSFSNKENATRLVGQLRDEGYRAYQRVGDSFARVYVGPYPVKGEAENRISALEKLVGAKVKVIEFDPKQH